MKDVCPECGEPLHEYPKYLYCYRCSRQYKRKMFGRGLKEIENTIQRDQIKNMGR